MKRVVVLVVLALIMFSLVACNPSNMALWKKQRDTGYSGGLLREITIYNTFTGDIVFQKTGKCFIQDDASAGDFMIYWSDENKKTDFLGHGLSMVAVEK
jgi:hypothetical protein